MPNFMDQPTLDLCHTWQNDRNRNGEDPTDGAAFADWLRAIGKDPTKPRDYGAIAISATPAPPVLPAYAPTVKQFRAPAASIQGTYTNPPKGVILHGSRSGQPLTEAQEFAATAAYCQSGTGGNDLAWTATIGPDLVGVHLEPSEWGFNAGAASREYLAVEFSQPKLTSAISDAQVRAFCWAFANLWRKRWPALPLAPLAFPTHASLPQGMAAGKTDVYPSGSSDAAALVARIIKRLNDAHGLT